MGATFRSVQVPSTAELGLARIIKLQMVRAHIPSIGLTGPNLSCRIFQISLQRRRRSSGRRARDAAVDPCRDGNPPSISTGPPARVDTLSLLLWRRLRVTAPVVVAYATSVYSSAVSHLRGGYLCSLLFAFLFALSTPTEPDTMQHSAHWAPKHDLIARRGRPGPPMDAEWQCIDLVSRRSRLGARVAWRRVSRCHGSGRCGWCWVMAHACRRWDACLWYVLVVTWTWTGPSHGSHIMISLVDGSGAASARSPTVLWAF